MRFNWAQVLFAPSCEKPAKRARYHCVSSFWKAIASGWWPSSSVARAALDLAEPAFRLGLRGEGADLHMVGAGAVAGMPPIAGRGCGGRRAVAAVDAARPRRGITGSAAGAGSKPAQRPASWRRRRGRRRGRRFEACHQRARSRQAWIWRRRPWGRTGRAARAWRRRAGRRSCRQAPRRPGACRRAAPRRSRLKPAARV